MLYQTFRKFPDGTLAKFGRVTANLPLAVERAAAHQGEVRPLGSLTPCWIAHTFLSPVAPLQPVKLVSIRKVHAPRFVSPVNPVGGSAQSNPRRYHPKAK